MPTKDKAKAAEQKRRLYQENPQRYIEAVKRYQDSRKDDPEFKAKRAAISAAWQKAHPERVAEIKKKHKEAHPDAYRVYAHRHNVKRYASLTAEQRREKGRKERARLAGIRLEAIQHYGGACYLCGETETRFLCIDHINGGGTEHRRHTNYRGTGDWARANGYPPIFRVSCCNCNEPVPEDKLSTSYEAVRRRARQREAIEHYGAVCYCCGEKRPRMLVLDHIEGGGRMYQKQANGLRLGTWAKRNGYPPTLRVACWNCNHGAWLNGGICPHQQGG